jgi:hypothetical protein
VAGRFHKAGNGVDPRKQERKQTMTSTEKAKPPVRTLRAGGLLYAKIWERATEKGTFYSVSFERRYKAANGKWATTHSFSKDDLLSLAKLADQAHTEIRDLLTPENDE